MKKERRIIIDASPCDTDLYPECPATVAEVKRVGRCLCPFFSECDKVGGLLQAGHQCAMRFGVQVAQYAMEAGHSVDVEMADFRREMSKELLRIAPKGIIWSPDRKTFEVITDIEKGIQRVGEFAKMLLEGYELKDAKAQVKRSFGQLVTAAIDGNGCIDLAKIDALEGSCGRNGGRGCDVTSGPCSCGAWH